MLSSRRSILRTALGSALLARQSVAAPTPEPRLALLIGAAGPGETGIHNDVTAAHDALRARGFAPEQILALDGNLNRSLVTAFVTEAGRRVRGWTRGEIFLYYSGHGAYTGTDPAAAEPVLDLAGAGVAAPAERLPWTELFGALQPPAGVRFTLLPDC